MSKQLIEIKGFEELKSKILELSKDKEKKSEILMILRQVAKPTLQIAQSLVPVSRKPHYLRGKLIQPGNLQKSLGFISSKSQNPTVLVGARVKGQNNGFYAHFVHNGVNVYNKGYKRKRTYAGMNDHAAVSRTSANPFLTKAFEVTEGLVTSDAEKRITNFIQRRIDKLSTNV